MEDFFDDDDDDIDVGGWERDTVRRGVSSFDAVVEQHGIEIDESVNPLVNLHLSIVTSWFLS